MSSVSTLLKDALTKLTVDSDFYIGIKKEPSLFFREERS